MELRFVARNSYGLFGLIEKLNNFKSEAMVGGANSWCGECRIECIDTLELRSASERGKVVIKVPSRHSSKHVYIPSYSSSRELSKSCEIKRASLRSCRASNVITILCA